MNGSFREPPVLERLAGLYLQLGELFRDSEEKQVEMFEKGARLAKQALVLQEDLADAHFYYAANLGRATQIKGVMASALVVAELKTHAERAVELKEDHAPALHMLGRMLDELPWFLGGDEEAALQYLQKAVSADEYDAHARLDLAKFHLKRQDISSAIRELERIISHPGPQPSWSWRHQYRPEAERILKEFRIQKGA
ncbi:MAG: tetratricopeptide repeat protein [Nitrospirales bacterium]